MVVGWFKLCIGFQRCPHRLHVFFDDDFACFRDGFAPPLRSSEVIDFLKAFSALADGDSKVGSKF